MNRIVRNLLIGGTLVAFCTTLTPLNAQEAEKKGGDTKGGDRNRQRGGGNFNPEEFRQRMAERMKEQFEVKSDDEWKIISERIEKVGEARRETMGGFGGFGGGFRGGPPGGGPGGPGGERGAGGGRAANPDVEALQNAIEAKASAEELKSRMEAVRRSRKAGEEKLQKAQDDLRAVLTVRQEAQALLMGLLQ